MRGNQRVLCLCDSRCNEIRDILLDLPHLERFYDRVLVDKSVAGKIQDDYIVLHLCNRVLVDHAARFIGERYMDCYVMTFRVDLVQVRYVMNMAGQAPCRLHGDERVISVDFHTEIRCCICNHNANRTETDDTELLAADLVACELLFLLLNLLREVFRSLLLLEPLDTAHDVTRSQKHSGNYKFLDTVGVRSRCVKYDDSFLRAHIQRNVVDACTGPCDALQVIGKFHFLHICTSYENRICVRRIHLLVILIEVTEPDV